MTQPREHCGELPPDMGLLRTVPAGECVLHPGHSGSHAAENGMRWTLASAQPASTAAPAPAVRDRELEQLRADRDMLRRNFRRALDAAEAANARATSAEAAIARVRKLAERWNSALGIDKAYARKILATLDPQEQP